MTRFPSMQALRAIESVERNGSLWKAAEELHVTRSAVSHQLRLLERDLGFKILERSGNHTAVTPRARAYAQDVRQALNMIAKSSSRASQNGLSGTLTLSCPAGFLGSWLCLYIRDFAEANPDITLNVLTASRMLDTHHPGVDAFVTFGLDPKAKVDAVPLHSVEFTPLCSPAYLTRFDGFSDPRSLERATLLHMGSYRDWRDWMDLCDQPPENAERGICFSDMHLVHTAVLAGQGIALGDTVLWARDLQTGALMRPFAQTLHTETMYFFCTAHEAPQNPLVDEFRKWLISNINVRDFSPQEGS